MLLRYDQRGKISINPLGKDMLKELDRKVADLRKLRKRKAELSNSITEIVNRVVGRASSDAVRRVLASKYLRARATKRTAKNRVLLGLYQDPGTWDLIAEEWSQTPSPTPAVSIKPSKEQFLLYLTAPEASYLQLVGCVLSGVMGERFRIKASSMNQKFRIPRAYKWVSDRYVNALDISDEGLQRIPLIYRIARLKEHGIAIQAARRHVFLAARVLSEVDEQVYCAHLDWIRDFQHRVLRRYLTAKPAERSSQYWATTLRTFRRTLQNDSLLNCVFHNEVFRGWKWLVVSRQRGGQALPAEGLTIAHAVKQLMQDLPKHTKPIIEEVLKGYPSDMRHVMPEGEDAEKRDVYAYAAPLMNALIRWQELSYPYTRESVRGNYSRYRKMPKLAGSIDDLREELRRIDKWIWSLESLP